MARKKVLIRLGIKSVIAFKIANRKGYAALVRNHLTEGRTVAQAYTRLIKACRRSGYELPNAGVPRVRSKV